MQSLKGCPDGTTELGVACVETAQRSAQTFFAASTTCAQAGRRLPTAGELTALSDINAGIMNSNDEVTSSIYADDPGNFQYISVDNAGTIDDPTTTTAGSFRCVAEPEFPG